MANPRTKASSKLLQENDRVIVTEWRLAPGAETGWHRHSYDFGQAYARPVGVEHNIVNPGGKEFAFVEVEIK